VIVLQAGGHMKVVPEFFQQIKISFFEAAVVL
jgi:hypothetical protein